jgi:hypothetical protein
MKYSTKTLQLSKIHYSGPHQICILNAIGIVCARATDVVTSVGHPESQRNGRQQNHSHQNGKQNSTHQGSRNVQVLQSISQSSCHDNVSAGFSSVSKILCPFKRSAIQMFHSLVFLQEEPNLQNPKAPADKTDGTPSQTDENASRASIANANAANCVPSKVEPNGGKPTKENQPFHHSTAET